VSPDSTTSRRCTMCGDIKPFDCFYKDKRASDGCQSRCKACWNELQRIKRATPEAKEYNRDYQRKWNENNREKRREISRRFYANHSDELREYWEKFRREKRELVLERGRRYANSDRGKEGGRAARSRRRTKLQDNGGKLTIDDLAAIRAAQTDKQGRLICWRCGKPITGTPHLDHWIPVKHGGTSNAGNMHYMHARCNISKNAKHPTEIGRLI